jgi:hypothetical protein
VSRCGECGHDPESDPLEQRLAEEQAKSTLLSQLLHEVKDETITACQIRLRDAARATLDQPIARVAPQIAAAVARHYIDAATILDTLRSPSNEKPKQEAPPV